MRHIPVDTAVMALSVGLEAGRGGQDVADLDAELHTWPYARPSFRCTPLHI